MRRILCFLFLSIQALGATTECPSQAAYEELAENFFQDFAGSLQQWSKGRYDDRVKAIDSALFNIALLRSPSYLASSSLLQWSDVTLLDNAIQGLENIRVREKAMPPGQQGLTLEEAAGQLMKIGKFRKAIEGLRSQYSSFTLDHPYAPLEYEIKSEYFRRLARLNELLPESLRTPIPKLPPDIDTPRIVSLEVNRIMREQHQRVSGLVPSSGFPNLEEVRNRVEQDPATAQAARLFAANGMRAGIYVPDNLRDPISVMGFVNARIAKASNSSSDIGMRNFVQAQYLGMPLADYEKLNPLTTPISGFVTPAPETGMLPFNSYAANYGGPGGGDIYILKPAALEHTLIHYGDSNNDHPYMRSPQAKKKLSTTLLSITPEEVKGYHPPTQVWDDAYLPWECWPLFAASMGFQNDRLESQMPTVRGFTQGHDTPAMYYETNTFGHPTLDDVESFVFTRVPPEGAFLKSLQQRHITIWDGRLGTRPVKWEPK